jgi:hypothetical protein
MTKWSLAAAALALACEASPKPAPPPAAALAPARPPSAEGTQAARARLLVLRTREPIRPARFAERRCDDSALATRPEVERELSLRVTDGRYDKRHVLPMRVTRHVTAPDLNRLDQILAGVEAPDEKEAALSSVERLSRQRLVGVHHVVHYVAPKWVVRVGKLKPAWEAGRIDTWFAVHDAATGEALCSTRVSVVGDATGAPLRVRLRSDTRDRLTDALGERLRRATSDALAKISGALLLPGAGPQR